MNAPTIQNMKFISADNENYSYSGRIDFTDTTTPLLYYAGSSITLNFSGTSAKLLITNHQYYNTIVLGFIIDGKEGKLIIDKNDKPIVFDVVDGLENKPHELIIFKRQDATHYFDFHGLYIDNDAEISPPKPKPKRRIECFGDSVSAGAICEAIDYTEKLDPEDNDGTFDNAWHSYCMITARNLGAEIHNVSQGGIGVIDGTGYFHAPEFIGLETVYDKLCYIPEGIITTWNFSRYTPHVVIVAVGQNDPHNEGKPDNDISNPSYRRKWKDKYKSILTKLRGHYPNTTFILMTTVLMHSPEWDCAIEEAMQELICDGFGKIYHLLFKRNGSATPGHPRIPEQCEMAEELTAFISNLGDKIWK